MTSHAVMGQASWGPDLSMTHTDVRGRYLRLVEHRNFGSNWVMRAWDQHLGRGVLLKFAMRGARHHRGERQLLVESEHMFGLSGLNIPQVYGLDRDCDGYLVLSLQWIEGFELRDFIIYGCSDVEALNRSALLILARAARTLERVHQKGLVHRDLKPEHLLRSTAGPVVVLDWGAAAPVGAREPTSYVVGTPSYMSLEQAMGAPADPSMDIYATGAMLYEILTGAPPVPDDEPALVLERLRRGPPPTVARRSPSVASAWPALSRACDAALSPCALDRPKTAGELADTIEATLGGRP